MDLTAKGQPVEFGRNAKQEWQIIKPKPQRADNGQVEDLVQNSAMLEWTLLRLTRRLPKRRPHSPAEPTLERPR